MKFLFLKNIKKKKPPLLARALSRLARQIGPVRPSLFLDLAGKKGAHASVQVGSARSGAGSFTCAFVWRATGHGLCVCNAGALPNAARKGLAATCATPRRRCVVTEMTARGWQAERRRKGLGSGGVRPKLGPLTIHLGMGSCSRAGSGPPGP